MKTLPVLVWTRVIGTEIDKDGNLKVISESMLPKVIQEMTPDPRAPEQYLQVGYFEQSFILDGPRIILLGHETKSTVLDLSRDSWTEPMERVFGCRDDLLRKCPPPRVVDATMHLVSKESKSILGETRDIIKVQVDLPIEEYQNQLIQYVFASGLGFIHDLDKLTRIEHLSANEIQTVRTDFDSLQQAYKDREQQTKQ